MSNIINLNLKLQEEKKLIKNIKAHMSIEVQTAIEILLVSKIKSNFEGPLMEYVNKKSGFLPIRFNSLVVDDFNFELTDNELIFINYILDGDDIEKYEESFGKIKY